MQIKAVLFDLDQTLIDFMKMKVEACRSAIEAMIKVGLKIDKKEGLKKLMETYFRLGIESDIAFSKFLEEQTGRIDDEIFFAYQNDPSKSEAIKEKERIEREASGAR